MIRLVFFSPKAFGGCQEDAKGLAPAISSPTISLSARNNQYFYKNS